MTTSLTAQALFLDGVTDNAQALREQIASALLSGGSATGTTGIAVRAGVRPGQGTPLKVSASSGMNISIAAGVAFIQGTASTTAGIYTLCLDTGGTVTVATSDPTNPRIDNVIAVIVDNGNNTSTASVQLQTGVPGSSPVAPTLPGNSLLLAQISVAANASSIVAGNITDKRVFTAAAGGIIPVRTSTDKPSTTDTPLYRHRLDVSPVAGGTSPLEYSVDGTNFFSVFDFTNTKGKLYVCLSSSRPTGVTGLAIYETDTGRIMVWTGSAWAQAAPPPQPSWQNATMASGFTAGSPVPQYLANAATGSVYLMGHFTSSGTLTGGASVTILTGVPTPSNAVYLAIAGPSEEPVTIGIAGGSVTMYPQTTYGGGSAFNLGGSYSTF